MDFSMHFHHSFKTWDDWLRRKEPILSHICYFATMLGFDVGIESRITKI